MSKQELSSINCPFKGMAYFAFRPYLWMAPLSAAAFTLIVMIALFIGIAYFSWPSQDMGWLSYLWDILKSFGIASLAILLLWVTLFPMILNVAFEKMCGKILREKGEKIDSEGLLSAAISSIYVIFRTLGWRLFWPISAFLSLFFFGPLAILLAHIGMGHIAMIDGIDLSLSVQGSDRKKRIAMMKERSRDIFICGLIAGLLSLILSITIIGWVFWLPGMYAGSVLWTMHWKHSRA